MYIFLPDAVMKQLENDENEINKAQANISKLTHSLSKTREKTSKLLQQATVFKLSKCKLCSEDLTLPSIHFLCGHSFHKVNILIFNLYDKDLYYLRYDKYYTPTPPG